MSNKNRELNANVIDQLKHRAMGLRALVLALAEHQDKSTELHHLQAAADELQEAAVHLEIVEVLADPSSYGSDHDEQFDGFAYLMRHVTSTGSLLGASLRILRLGWYFDTGSECVCCDLHPLVSPILLDSVCVACDADKLEYEERARRQKDARFAQRA